MAAKGSAALGLVLTALLSLAPAYGQEAAEPSASIETWYSNAALPDPTPPMPVVMRGHSHNDYRQDHPLTDALAQGFYSVEADIWLANDQIMVGHLPFLFKGELEELYLQPLQAIVNAKGSVYGDGMPFYLWIDIKDWRPELAEMLMQALDRYPMLTAFTDQGRSAAPVIVILTGKDATKKWVVEQHAVRHAIRDSNDYSAADPPADFRWSWYALKWSDYIGWNGGEPMPAAERAKLAAVVAGAHQKNRRVRFWDVPGSEDVWQAAFDAGVDQISADDLPRFKKFLDDQAKLLSNQ